jgi:hypothetical protein
MVLPISKTFLLKNKIGWPGKFPANLLQFIKETGESYA